jgi:hypothetical protein
VRIERFLGLFVRERGERREERGEAGVRQTQGLLLQSLFALGKIIKNERRLVSTKKDSVTPFSSNDSPLFASGRT